MKILNIKLLMGVVPKILTCLACIVLLPVFSLIQAQQIDLLLKGGHLIDPKNGIDEPMDLAISDGKILQVAKDISADQARKVVDVSGLYVTPGFINMHTHVYAGSNPGFTDGTSSVFPDAFSFRSGITTVVDAGTSGWKTFPDFKKKIIDISRTRVLAFLNIAASGYSTDNAQENISEMNPRMTALTVKEYPDIIVGVRVGRFTGSDWAHFDRGVEAAEATGTPLFVECHLPEYSLKGQLDRMRPGDILTHAFEDVSEREPVVNEQGQVEPYVLEARDRGILFDVGHGGAGFWFSQAIPAYEQGLWPDSFGTDQHRWSMNAGMKSMINVMSKYLNIGMSLNDVIERATWRAAKAINRTDLGHLSEGAVADIAVVNLKRGNFGFVDAGNNRIEGDRKLIAEMTIRAGNVEWDLNGLSARPLQR